LRSIDEPDGGGVDNKEVKVKVEVEAAVAVLLLLVEAVGLALAFVCVEEGLGNNMAGSRDYNPMSCLAFMQCKLRTGGVR